MRPAPMSLPAGPRLAALALALVFALVPVLAASVTPALAQESEADRFVPLKGMFMPLMGKDRRLAGTLHLDLSIEARQAADAPAVRTLLPRIRDALLTEVPPPVPAEGLNISSAQLADFKRRLLLAVRHALGAAAAVSDVHFVTVLTMPE